MTADEDWMADEYERPNKSLLKREAEDMKRLGDELVRMAPADLAQIPLPENLRDAIELVRRIHGGGITIVIVEHIMEVITQLTHRVVVFHQGREISRGTPREVTSDPRVIEAYLGRRHVKHA